MQPIFCFHSISNNPGSQIAQFNVTPENFAKQLDLIQQEGLQTVTFSELLNRWTLDQPTNGLVVLTFDDGYRDFATAALPELLKRKMTATLYVTTGFLAGDPSVVAPGVPSDEMLDWSQLNELDDAGIEIGAHSHTHPHLDTLKSPELRVEVFRPKGLLEDALNHPIASFAYPHGYTSRRVKKMVQLAGYESAAGVRNLFSHQRDDRFNIARIMLEATHSNEMFLDWLRLSGAGQAGTSDPVKTKLWRSYRRMKASFDGTPINEYTSNEHVGAS